MNVDIDGGPCGCGLYGIMRISSAKDRSRKAGEDADRGRPLYCYLLSLELLSGIVGIY